MVVLFRGVDKGEVSLLNNIHERHIRDFIPLGDLDDQPQVGFNQPLAGPCVPLLYQPGQLQLLLKIQKGNFLISL